MTAGLVLFNLLANAAVAFAGALGLVLLARRVFRVEPGRTALVLLVLPFAKALLEVARGIPAGGFFWARLAGATQEQGAFRIGVGLTPPAVPLLELSLGAHAQGHVHPQSIADVALAALTRAVAPEAPAAAGLALAVASGLGFAAWAVGRWRASRRTAALLRAAELVEVRPVGRRSVRVLATAGLDGVPCAGGLLRPWIWVPGATWAALGADEREAVLAHELAHVRSYDLALLSFVEAARWLLVFVPGAGALARAVRLQAELAADASARRAASGAALASALVRVAERGVLGAPVASPLALVSPRSVLATRVDRLLDAPASPVPRGRVRKLVRVAGFVLIVAAVLRATLLGNGW